MEPTAQNTNIDFIEALLTSFESRIQKIETVFITSDAVNEFSYALMNDFQISMKELKKERTQLNDLLRGNMAKNGSLRKNDYDILMDDIFILLDEKEKEAESSFHLYIEDQKPWSVFYDRAF